MLSGAAGFPRRLRASRRTPAVRDADVPGAFRARGRVDLRRRVPVRERQVLGSTATGADMNPGRACIACHFENTGEPKLVAGGTVYAATREPDRCYGEAGVVVAIETPKSARSA